MDQSVISAAQHGDREAFAALGAALARPFLGVARRILRDLDLAEDATQEALVGIWHGLPQLRDPDRFDAWAYRLLVRACHVEASKARRWARDVRSLPLDRADPADDVGALIDRDQLERAFRRLSFDHRTAVVLRYYLDLPLAQVAEILGVPEGTVSSRLHYAMGALRSAVDADARPAAKEAFR